MSAPSPAKSPRKRKVADTTAATDPNHRIWTDADTLFVLNAAVKFRYRTGDAPKKTTMPTFFDAVKDSIPPQITPDQLWNKIRTFRQKYSKIVAAGGDDTQFYKLADDLWGVGKKEKTRDENVVVGDEEVGEGDGKGKKKKKGDSEKPEVEIEKKKKKPGDENAVVGSEKVGEGSTKGKKQSKDISEKTEDEDAGGKGKVKKANKSGSEKAGDENGVGGNEEMGDMSTKGKKKSKAISLKTEDEDAAVGNKVKGKKIKMPGSEKAGEENGAGGNKELGDMSTKGKNKSKAISLKTDYEGDAVGGKVKGKDNKKSGSEKIGDANGAGGNEGLGDSSTKEKKKSKDISLKNEDEDEVVGGQVKGKKMKKSGSEKAGDENGAGGNEELGDISTKGKKKKGVVASETTDAVGSKGKERKKAESAVVTKVEAIREEKDAGSEEMDDTEEDAGIQEKMDVDGGEENGGAEVSCPVYRHNVMKYRQEMAISEELFEAGLKVANADKVRAYERKWRKHQEENFKLNVINCEIDRELYMQLGRIFK